MSVYISLDVQGSFCLIFVSTQCGMPPEVLPLVTAVGMLTNKCMVSIDGNDSDRDCGSSRRDNSTVVPQKICACMIAQPNQ